MLHLITGVDLQQYMLKVSANERHLRGWEWFPVDQALPIITEEGTNNIQKTWFARSWTQ